MIRSLGISAALLGMVAVILGAWGAHGLKPHIEPERMSLLETAMLYMFVHVLAALICAFVAGTKSNRWLVLAGYSFIAGSVLFSGSLYLLAARDFVTVLPPAILGPVTPVGGLLFVLGWICLLIYFIRLNNS